MITPPAGAAVLAVRALAQRRTTAALATALLAAVLANLINNLPAVLVLLPLAAPAGPGAVLAVLLGVNIGPNLTFTGSLATLLWRRVLHERGSGPVVAGIHQTGTAHRRPTFLIHPVL